MNRRGSGDRTSCLSLLHFNESGFRTLRSGCIGTESKKQCGTDAASLKGFWKNSPWRLPTPTPKAVVRRDLRVDVAVILNPGFRVRSISSTRSWERSTLDFLDNQARQLSIVFETKTLQCLNEHLPRSPARGLPSAMPSSPFSFPRFLQAPLLAAICPFSFPPSPYRDLNLC